MIDVALTRHQLRRADVAVVLDVLRATSTVTAALAGGYPTVLCAESVARARSLRRPGRILAGECDCLMPDGFDQGNSPAEAFRRRGEELVLATTNGAPAVLAATATASRVILACLRNLEAVITELNRLVDPMGGSEVQIVCSGTNGRVGLEDVYVAGRLAARLPGPRTDAALVAEAVGRGFPSTLQALEASEDAEILRSVGLSDDVVWCAQESTLDVVPIVSSVDAGVCRVTSLCPNGLGRRDSPPPLGLGHNTSLEAIA
ncbi:MAG TPA: 2-phosphosulfolactate phosphatase [Solirubrobacteraceae bacterium]|nr:2-phosphosulfolactate phosphatase [Solirubrobacteraceae bacterium]